MSNARHVENPVPGRSSVEVLANAVAELDRLDDKSLRRRWRALVGGAVPADLGRLLALRVLAYKLQAQHLGELDKASSRELSNLGARLKGRVDPSASPDSSSSEVRERSGRSGASAMMQPKVPALRVARPGTQLMREHGGVLHRVMVLEEGVIWNGMTYDSLSAVALAITGTKWNGPRFFGLREPAASTKDDRRKSSSSATLSAIGRGRAAKQSAPIAT